MSKYKNQIFILIVLFSLLSIGELTNYLNHGEIWLSFYLFIISIILYLNFIFFFKNFTPNNQKIPYLCITNKTTNKK